MTEATTAVDAPRTVMWSIRQIADRDGISKQAVSKKVAQLVERHGLAVERNERGFIGRVNVAEYDHLRGRTDDPSKMQRSPANEREIRDSESYDEALRQKTWHEAEKRRLELETLKGQLVPVSALADAAAAVSDDILRVLERMPGYADEIAAAVAKDGAAGARFVLKSMVNEQRKALADSLQALTLATRTENAA